MIIILFMISPFIPLMLISLIDLIDAHTKYIKNKH